MEYQCRGRVQSIKLGGIKVSFCFKAKTQFLCSENEIAGDKKFNILFDVSSTTKDPPIVAIATGLEIQADINYIPVLTLSRDEDATIIVKNHPTDPAAYELSSIKVGRDDG